MIHYLLLDKDGVVQRRGACGSVDDIPEVAGLYAEIVSADDERRPGPPIMTAAMVRAHQYPSVGDQLGAIWKAIAPLIEHPEADAILAKIQAVKDANPKPTNSQ